MGRSRSGAIIARLRRAWRKPKRSPESRDERAALDDATHLTELVTKLYGEAKFMDAIPSAERCLAIRQELLGPLHPKVAESLNNLAVLHDALGAYDQSEPLLLRAVEINRQALGELHPDFALILVVLGGHYRSRAMYERSETLLARALEIFEQGSATSPHLVTILNNLAGLHIERADHKKAEALLLRAFDLAEHAAGPSDLGVAWIAHNLGSCYRAQGLYRRAEPHLVRAVDVFERILGPAHPDLATAIDNLAQVHDAQGRRERALQLSLRALEIREQALGPVHRGVVISLNNLGALYMDQGSAAEAESLLLRAHAIVESTQSWTHPAGRMVLLNLAMVYEARGANDKAEALLVRALEILQQTLGARHPEVAMACSGLATVYETQGAYDKAELLRIRALEIAETALGPLHPDVAQSLNNLAVIYVVRGVYRKAESLLTRALDNLEQQIGGADADAATVRNNLAMLHEAQGAYAKAEPLLLRALEISERAMGAMHPEVAERLNNLADRYRVQGAYGKAESLLVRALEIREQALGPMHLHVATSLHGLAALHGEQGAWDAARPLLVRALHIREQALGPDHRDVAASLVALADLYRTQGKYGTAGPLYLRALKIEERALGPTHPDIVPILEGLAAVHHEPQARERVEALHLRALEIRERALDPMHPDLAVSLHHLAALYRAQGSPGEALPLVQRAAAIREDQLRRELPQLSERHKRAMMVRLQAETESVISLHADAMPASRDALSLALTTILRRKGRVLDSLAENQSNLSSCLSTAGRRKYQEFTDANTELSALLRARFDPRSAVRNTHIVSLRAHIDALQSILHQASAELGVASEPVTIAKVQAALPEDAALVEFVRYRRFDPAKTQPWREPRYVAYVLTRRDPPRWVDLGQAAPIEEGIDAMLAAIPEAPGGAAMRSALRRLDASVFAPIRDQLTEISHVIVSPDGKLSLVPFDALVDTQEHYLLENTLVSYVGSGRDLLRRAVRRVPRSPPMIVAAPEYGPPQASSSTGPGTFHPLTGALAEAQDLSSYLRGARRLIGEQATKAALAAAVGPSVLHVATHGFYARQPVTSPVSARPPLRRPSGAITLSMLMAAPRRLLGESALAGSSPSTAERPSRSTKRDIIVDEPAFSSAVPEIPTSEDPGEALDRAGLALAGANLGPDGIMSARELATCDWWGTKLAVLSACDTGVGPAPSGEGVYGMRRALALSGTESQVVTLWSVDDASTRTLMQRFYAELARGAGRAEALRLAKLHLLRHSMSTHPRYWAACILAGDWTPLDPAVCRAITLPSAHGTEPRG